MANRFVFNPFTGMLDAVGDSSSSENAWLQGGNTPTVSGILGTLDNVDFHIVRAGQYRVNIFENVVRISGIIEGGNSNGGDLILRPNPSGGYNNVTDGFIRLNGRIRNTESFTPTQVLGSMINFINNWGTTSLEAVFPTAYRTQSSGKYNYTTTGASPGPGGLLAFDCNNTVEKTASGIDTGSLTKWQAAEMRMRWRYNSAGAGGTRLFGNYQAASSVDNVNGVSSGLATIDRYYGFGMSSFTPSPINYVGAGVNVDEFDGFWMPQVAYSGTVGEIYGLAVDDQAGGTITTRRAAIRASLIRRLGSDGLTKSYNLWCPGSAVNVIAGNLRVGDTDDPIPTLSGIDVAGQIQVGNKLTTVASGIYNFIQANGDAVSGAQLHTLFNAPGGFVRGYFLSGRIDFSLGDPAGASSGALFAFNASFAAGANNRTMSGFQGFSNNAAFTPETFSGITNWTVRTLNHAPVIGSLSGSNTHAEYPRIVGVISQGAVLVPTGGSIIINDWTGMLFSTPTILGTDRVNRITALEIDDITGGITRRSVWSKGPTVEFVNAGGGVFGANSGVSNASVGLELNSATKAFLPSRLTTGAVNALTAIDGMIVYDSGTATHKARQGGAWVEFPGPGSSGTTVATDVVTGSSSEIPDGSDLTCNTVTTTPGSGTDVFIIGTLTWSKSTSANRQVTIKFFKDGSEVDTADRHTLMNTGGAGGQTVTMTGHWVIASESAGSHTYTLRATDDTGGAPTANRIVSRLTVMY